MPRTRSRYLDPIYGSCNKSGYTETRNLWGAYEVCTDENTSPGVPHDLEIVKKTIKPCLMNGSYDAGYGTYFSATNCRTTNPSVAGEGATHHSPLVGLPSWVDAATKTVARTNPSRAHVQLPVFIKELGDLPRLVRLEGNNLIQKAASGNLSYQFGWKPLISDLTKMLSFHDAVEKTVRELKRIQAKGGVRRKVKLGTFSATTNDGPIAMESWLAIVDGTRTRVTQAEMWGTVVWKPTGAFPKTDSAMRDYAWKTVRGFHIGQQMSNLWEAIPWSWLIDWFANVGDVLVANQNSYIHTPTRVCVMLRTSTTCTWKVTRRSNWLGTLPPAYTTQVTKQRKVLSPGLTASVPFLSAGQLSILGSLHVLGKLPGSRR